MIEITCVSEMVTYIYKIAARGIKQVEFNEEELYMFLESFSNLIPANINVSSGNFIFWGIKIIKKPPIV